jgi:hypothetical protein
MRELHQQIEDFKAWASSTDQRFGEWELNYEHWDSLYASAADAVTTFREGAIPPDVADDLLYALARDNECEHIRESLSESPELLSALAKRATVTGDAKAKWQIAVSLAESKLLGGADLLRPFLTDSDEYVRRRSLLAFAVFAPEEAEAIAINNLDDDFEYTRIAALHVLHSVESQELASAFERLKSDPNEYVRRNVAELQITQRKA